MRFGNGMKEVPNELGQLLQFKSHEVLLGSPRATAPCRISSMPIEMEHNSTREFGRRRKVTPPTIASCQEHGESFVQNLPSSSHRLCYWMK